VRPFGLHKGAIVPTALSEAPDGALVLAMGDDRTDEDLFSVLPEDSVSIHVGPKTSVARLRVEDPAQARAFLRSLV